MKVIYDGECPVCLALKDFAETKNTAEALEFVPYQSDQLGQIAPGLSPQQASQALVTVDEKGGITHGAGAVFEIMKSIPGFWRVAGKIGSYPPLTWIAEPLYRLFARHRHKISTWL
jgi:predicted DCC family thiol-disulfide oxidoreductase YuxK